MSPWVLSRRFCSKWVSISGRDSVVMKQRLNSVFMPGQSRCYGTPGSCTGRSRLSVWVGGVGVGIALSVGLSFAASSSSSEDDDDDDDDLHKVRRYRAAVAVSRELLQRVQAEVGAPGMVVGVSVDGAHVWSEGIGYADLENRVHCTPETVMRIASISKPLTSAAAARLCEEGKLDLDAPVQKYVPDFPQKQFDGENVTITPRMILSHLSGIRHYEKDARKVKEEKEKAKRLLKPQVQEQEEKSCSRNKEKNPADQTRRKKEFEQEEYYLKDNYNNVTQALELFKDDPLIFKPGSTFLYSTHAFTLLSAVMEGAAGQSFLDLMRAMFRELGMLHTVPDENDPIIYHRARFYHFNKRGRLVNCRYVDNSYKWAGGGFLSTVGDLLRFGSVLLYSFQKAQLKDGDGMLPGFLQPQTATDLWTPVDRTEPCWDKDGLYAQGWLVVEKQQKFGQCRKRRYYVSHTGGAVGTSSVLLVLPSEKTGQCPPPQGVVVTILTNMQSVGLNNTALRIAQEFEKTGSVEE